MLDSVILYAELNPLNLFASFERHRPAVPEHLVNEQSPMSMVFAWLSSTQMECKLPSITRQSIGEGSQESPFACHALIV